MIFFFKRKLKIETFGRVERDVGNWNWEDVRPPFLVAHTHPSIVAVQLQIYNTIQLPSSLLSLHTFEHRTPTPNPPEHNTTQLHDVVLLKMSYDYLFKYIIIGDTGTFLPLQFFCSSNPNIICIYLSVYLFVFMNCVY